MKKTVVVIDGMGGGIGTALIAKIVELKKSLAGETEIEIIALGANAAAAERMVKAGADRGAAGENAVRVSAKLGDVIMGPIGIVIGDSMLGEITQGMAAAVLAAPGKRILLPLQNDHFYIVGAESKPLAKQIDEAAAYLAQELKCRR